MSSNYVNMGDGSVKPGSNKLSAQGLDDPNLSQEEKDLRLALALQQQENAAAYESVKRRNQAKQSSLANRTSRSNAGTRLTAVRRKSLNSSSSVDVGSYAGPDDSSDARLASELHKVEVTTAKTASIIAQGRNDSKSAKMRSGRSVF